MGYRLRSSQFFRILSKTATFVLLFCFIFEPVVSFAQVASDASTPAPAASPTVATPSTTSSPSSDDGTGGFFIPIGSSSSGSGTTNTDASPGTAGTGTSGATPDSSSGSSATTQTDTTSNSSAGVANPSTDNSPTSAAATPSTGQSATTATTPAVTPDVNGIQPDVSEPTPPGSGAESPDLTRKAIDPKFYSSPDPVTGSLDYTYPISIPPGRNGVQPDVDLKYSSQPGPNVNVMGYGWDPGIPYIERLNKQGTDSLYSQNYFYSSVDGEIYQTATSSNTWGARVEDGNFNNYQLEGTSSSTQYWVMTDKSGTTYTFGTTTASRVDNPSNGGQIYKWMLERVQDANGNYVTYQYTKDEGEIYPFKINYTNASSTAGIFEIDYATTTRADVATSTASGFPVVSEWLIGAIQIKVNGTLLRNYALSYTAGVNSTRSLLSAVAETGYENGTTTLPATLFTYRTANKGWTPSSTNLVPPIPFDASTYLADLNGDGLVDILHSYEDTASNTAYINTGSQWVASSTWTPPVYFYSGTTDLGARLVDVNGDGLTDIVQSYNGVASTTQVYLNNGHGWTASSTWSIPVEITSSSSNDLGVRFADVNGDGLPDIIQSENGSSSVYINNGHGWTLDPSWTVPVDFADGGVDNYVRIEDVNGDGLPDLMQSYTTSTTTVDKVWINTGSSWVLDPQWTIPVKFAEWDGTSQWPDTGVRIADVNGDGLPDIVQAWSQTGDSATNTYINNGHSWTLDSTWNAPTSFVTDDLDGELRLADANGDGLLDLISSPASTTDETFINNSRTPDLLVKVTSPQGGSANYTYQSSQLYTSGGTLLNPGLPQSLDTVSSISLDNDLGAVASTSYSYQGGLYDYNGPFDRQFAGFFKVVKTDAAGNVTNTYYHQGIGTNSAEGEYEDSTPKIGKVYRIENYDSLGNLYSKSIYRWVAVPLSGNRNFVNLAQEVDSTYDGTSSHKDKATSSTYDNSNGDVLTKTLWGVVSGNDDGSFTDTGTDEYVTTNTYASSTSGIIVPTDSTTVDQNGNKVNEQTYYYDNGSLGSVTLGNLTKESQWISGSSTPIVASSTWAYNSLGLVTSQTDARGYTTTYGYDPYNLYPATTTNPLSQNTYTTYDYGSGQLATTTDPNGNVFASEYDGLGRLLQQIQPDTTASSTSLVPVVSYQYTDTALPSIAQTNYLSAATSTITYSYLDGFGRIVQSRTGAGAASTQSTQSLNYLIVAGGGGGGAGWSTSDSRGGGGGAGGVISGTASIPAGSYTVTVGSGGSGGATGSQNNGGNGTSSAFASTTATGGGGGGAGGSSYQGTNGLIGSSGGSGGGGGGGFCLSGRSGGTGVSGQGYAGGSSGGGCNQGSGGAGGGASAVGGNDTTGASPATGTGGAGISSSITGTSLTYGVGGNSGGVSPASGSAHTGNGGGGGSGAMNGYAGGSGIVVISYPTSNASNFTCGGTTTTSGSNTICTFNSTGTFTVVAPAAQNNGDNSTVDYQYNDLGLLSQQSLPYFSNGVTKTNPTTNTNLYTSYSYDPVYRVKTVTNAVGSTGYAYDDWVTTVTDADNHAKDLTYDAYGNLAQVTEHLGSTLLNTYYTYDGNQDLTKLTDSQGNVRNFTYDGLGRELTSQDLHAATDTSFGTWTYGYDAAGNKTSSLDPNGNTINYSYDALGRVLTEDYTGQSGIEKTYVYDSCTNGIGHLCSAADASATTTYAYDQLGNVATENDLITGTSTYTTQYVHDRAGNIIKQTYPDGSIVNYLYNSLGQLGAITEQERGVGTTSPIVSDITYGPDGQVTYQKNANGTETFNTYNQNALYRLVDKKTIGPGSGLAGFMPMAQFAEQQESLYATASTTNPIEDTALRTATSQTFVLGKDSNGKTMYSKRIYLTPVFTQDTSGDFMPVSETTFSPKTHDTWIASNSSYSAIVQAAVSSGLFTYTGNGTSLTFSLADPKENSSVTATKGTGANSNVFTFKNALGTGANLEITAADDFLKKDVELTSEPSQTTGSTTYDVTFKLAAIPGLDIKSGTQLLSTAHTITTSGEVEIMNGASVLAYIWPPVATDDSANLTPTSQIALSITYAMQTDGSILITKHIPYSWLATAKYPVRADFTISQDSGIGDGYVQTQPYPSSFATQQADTTGRGSDYTGTQMYAEVSGYFTPTGYLGISRSFLPFNTSSIPSNAVISSSTLNVYVASVSNQFNDGYNNMNVYQGFEATSTSLSNSDISKCGNTVTNPTKGTSDVSVGSISSGAFLSFPLNSTALGWINAASSTYTNLCIREGHDTSDTAISTTGYNWIYSGITMDTSETGSSTAPYLVVNYTVPPVPPTSPTGLQTNDQTDAVEITTPSPTFHATFNDANVLDTATNYEIQVSTSTSFTNPLWDSGETALSPNVYEGNASQDLSYTGTPLALDSSIYHWRMRFWDSANVGSWSTGADTFQMADNNSVLQHYQYSYDPVGNITQIIDSAVGSNATTTTYTYDSLNRLISYNETAPNSYYEVPISIHSSAITSTLTNFPVYVNLANMPSSFWTRVRSDGGDIRATDASGNQLPVEVADFNATSSTGDLYFKAASIGTATTTFYITYGNPASTTPARNSTYGSNNVWNSTDLLVYHMSQNPGGTAPQILDSTVYDRNATTTGSMTSSQLVPGNLGNAISFNQANGNELDYSSTTAPLDALPALTISAWLNLSGTYYDPVVSYGKLSSYTGNNMAYVLDTNGGYPELDVYNTSGQEGYAFMGSPLSLGSWEYLVASWSPSGGYQFYVNGVPQGSTSGGYGGNMFSSSDNVLQVGGFHDDPSSSYFNGSMDELQISDATTTATRVAALYANQSAPTSFYTVGAEVPVSTTTIASESFSYDSLGNILNKSDVGNYSYAGNTGSSYADPDAVTQIANGLATTTYAYDDNGNLTSGGGITNTWNYDNYLTQSVTGSSTVTYAYDASGNRKKMSLGTTYSYYPNQYYTQTGTTTEKDIYANGQLVAMVSNKTGSLVDYWNHPDYLGNENVVSSSTGLTTEDTTYYPFGSILSDRTNTGFNETRKFIDEPFDPSTAYNYDNARYENPSTGRFISQDPLSLGDTSNIRTQDPQSLNLYSYAEDNPVTKKDPSGDQTIGPSADIEILYLALAIAYLELAIALQTPVAHQAIQQASYNVAQRVQSVSFTPYGTGITGVSNTANSTPSYIFSNSVYPALPTPDDLAGKTPQEVDEIMKKKGLTGEPSNNQQGTRYPVPDRPGDQVRVQNGNPSDPNPVKQGPYGRVSQNGTVSDPFPLAGNPTLENPIIDIDANQEDSTPEEEDL